MTNWTTSRAISQYVEPGAETFHIPWKENEFQALYTSDQSNLGLNGLLIHIARSPKLDVVNKTYYLKLQNFIFTSLPDTISGIEMRLSMNRRGRVTDDTIQLLVNDQPVGENKADLNLDPIKVYGANNDKWGIDNLSAADITNNFGVLVRFRAHPQYPHRDGAFIDAVELRIY